MTKYIELNSIRTWYDERGQGEPLVMFHPGGVGVDSSVFEPNLVPLVSRFRIFLPERRGHGHTPDAPGNYSYELVADDMILFLERVVGEKTRILGMSDGAIVALFVTLKRPDLVERLICAGGVFNNTGWAPGVISPPDGKQTSVVEKKLYEMHTNGPKLTQQDLKKIRCRTLVMVGDDDEVVLEHALEFYRNLPQGELAVVPGTSHGLLVEKPDLCNKIIFDFMTLDPVQKFAPIRRK